jgi:hypothetical protein
MDVLIHEHSRLHLVFKPDKLNVGFFVEVALHKIFFEIENAQKFKFELYQLDYRKVVVKKRINQFDLVSILVEVQSLIFELRLLFFELIFVKLLHSCSFLLSGFMFFRFFNSHGDLVHVDGLLGNLAQLLIIGDALDADETSQLYPVVKAQ